MLYSLTVQNIALIENMTFPLYEGMHVLTGETGAGKSIIVDAMKLLMGGKAEKELLRTGAPFMRVEGVFDIAGCVPAFEWLQENEMQSEDDTLILMREVSAQGRSVCRVNGRAVQVNAYRELAGFLIELHGQHAFQMLTDEKRHMRFLDDFGDEKHHALLQDMREAFRKWKDARRERDRLAKLKADAEEKQRTLSAAKEELEKAELVPGEEELLQAEKMRFEHSGRIDAGLREVFTQVYDGGGSALERLREATRAADRLSGLGDDLRELSERVTALYYECEDIGLTAEKMLEKNDADPVRQEEVAARLDLLRRLERRYGTTPEMMLERLEEIRRELQEIEGVDERLEEAALQEEKLRENMLKRASALQASRKLWMQRFAQAVEAECRDLNMAGTRLEGEFAEKEMDESGDRTLRFLIAPNRGEAFRPLSQTASGGELSRLMLAVETAMAEKAPVPTMIFDEVDSGISGSAAQAVADKMRRLAKSHQVLCVTHLQQLAAAAEHHYFVRKSFNGERTQTDISELDRAGRVREIARLLGGDEKTALAHAEKMLRA